MATNAGVEPRPFFFFFSLCHGSRAAGGHFSSERRLRAQRGRLFCHLVALARFHCLQRGGLTAATCHQYEVLKRFRKCCRSFAGHTSSISLHFPRVVSSAVVVLYV